MCTMLKSQQSCIMIISGFQEEDTVSGQLAEEDHRYTYLSLFYSINILPEKSTTRENYKSVYLYAVSTFQSRAIMRIYHGMVIIKSSMKFGSAATPAAPKIFSKNQKINSTHNAPRVPIRINFVLGIAFHLLILGTTLLDVTRI